MTSNHLTIGEARDLIELYATKPTTPGALSRLTRYDLRSSFIGRVNRDDVKLRHSNWMPMNHFEALVYGVTHD